MPRYKITLAQLVIERAVVWIDDADSKDEAERLALQESRLNLADWSFADAFDDVEVISVEPVTTMEVSK